MISLTNYGLQTSHRLLQKNRPHGWYQWGFLLFLWVFFACEGLKLLFLRTTSQKKQNPRVLM